MLKKLRKTIVELKESAEICDLEDKINDGRILVVSPHPDDESIGCGGVILKYRERVDVLLLTDGRLGNPEWSYEETGKVRKREIEAAMDYAGIGSLYCLGYPDSGLRSNVMLDNNGGGVKWEQYQNIFVPNCHENHPDHRAAYHIIKKNVRKQKIHPKIFEYEVWTPIRHSNRYLNIDFEKKKQLLSYYQSQLKHIDYTSRILGLNRYRGMQLNYEYAEAYNEIVDGFNKFAQKVSIIIFKLYIQLLKKYKKET